MTHITIALPDDVAKQYYAAAEKLSSHLAVLGQTPDAQTLMRFTLSAYDADDITESFDRTLRNLVGAPVPDEPDVWIFTPGFEKAP